MSVLFGKRDGAHVSAIQADLSWQVVTLAPAESIILATYEGTSGKDTYIGGDANDDISGDAGHDSLRGSGGDDSIRGGTGNDTIYGDEGNDRLFGDLNNDSMVGNVGTDLLDGGVGDDRLYSAAPLGFYRTPYYDIPYATPVLDRDGATDSLVGGDGNDLLSAGFGDNVNGGAGSDTLFISFQGATSGVRFDLLRGTETIGGGTIQDVENIGWIEGSEFDDSIQAAVILTGDAPVVFGMGGDDSLVGGDRTEGLYGGNGDDILNGRLSDYLQRLEGGGGNDTLYSQVNTSSVTADGGDGNDLIYTHGHGVGGAGDDTIQMTPTFDYRTGDGGAGDDLLTTSYAAAILLGQTGADTLTGGYGDDLLTGGAGNDVLTGGENALGTTGDIAHYRGSGNQYQVTEDALTHVITVVDLRNASPDGTDTLDRSVEALKFSNGTYLLDVVLAGIGLGLMSLVGTDGDDTFVGSEEANTAVGRGGNDSFSGYGGYDTLEGGVGGDLLNGGTGNDRLYSAAPPGNYQMAGYVDAYVAPQLDRSGEADTLNGGVGNDTLSAGYGDKVDGGEGNDELFLSFQGASSGVTLDTDLAIQMIGDGSIQNVEYFKWIEGSEHADVFADPGGFYGRFETVLGMGGNDSLTAGYNTYYLYGNDGDDLVDGQGSGYLNRVDGGAGNDTLYTNDNTFGQAYGGDGDDLIFAHALTYGGAGNDTIQMVLTYYDDIAYGGDGNDNMRAANDLAATLEGEAGDDVLVGRNKYDVLDGGSGNDTIDGGAGNDTLTGGDGWDTASYADVTAGVTVNLSLTASQATGGAGSDRLTQIENLIGSAFNDNLTGDTGGNRLDGGGGADTLTGGLGNDTYDVDDAVDMVFEGENAGTDTVFTSVTYSLAGQAVENAVLTGSSDTNLTSNNLANLLSGNGGNNRLDGEGGRDTLVGEGGADTLNGGDGEDVLAGNDGNDSLAGDAGNDSLDGSSGADTLAGGLGDDTYLVDDVGDRVGEAYQEGTDTIISTVTYSLAGRWVENAILAGNGDLGLTGNSQSNNLSGNSGGNVLNGAGGNDSLAGGGGSDTLIGGTARDFMDGGAGADVLTGGEGNDTYVVDTLFDGITEHAGEGIDVIRTAISWSLEDEVETLELLGTENIDGLGNGLNNRLSGTAGNNRLDGAGGADTLAGGAGDDTYVVDSSADRVIEWHYEGNDLILASVSYSLAGRHVEVLELTGTGDIDANGNGLGNRLIGNAGDNVLNGLGGYDTLTGGDGADVFLFEAGSRKDWVTDFSTAQSDMIDIHAYAAGIVNEALVSQAGANVVIALSAGNVIMIENAARADVLSHMVW